MSCVYKPVLLGTISNHRVLYDPYDRSAFVDGEETQILDLATPDQAREFIARIWSEFIGVEK